MTRHTDEPPPVAEEGARPAPQVPPDLPVKAVRAFDDFVRTNYGRAVGVCRNRRLGQAQAEDVAQSALEVLWARWPQIGAWTPDLQCAYFFRVVLNMAARYHKGESQRRMLIRRIARVDPALVVAGTELVDLRADLPHQVVEDQEAEEELQRLLTHPQLNDNYRTSLRLIDDGLSAKERAGMKGITEGAERVQTHRARARAQAIKASEEESNQ